MPSQSSRGTRPEGQVRDAYSSGESASDREGTGYPAYDVTLTSQDDKPLLEATQSPPSEEYSTAFQPYQSTVGGEGSRQRGLQSMAGTQHHQPGEAAENRQAHSLHNYHHHHHQNNHNNHSTHSHHGHPTKVGKPTKRKRVISFDQRKAANIRERRRMLSLNDAFDLLRQALPTFSYEKKLSRIETLRLALTYMAFMTDILSGADPKEVRLLPMRASALCRRVAPLSDSKLVSGGGYSYYS